jgi:ring-1,2-phenylacetyl-CoA epoxidase subunit PaaC
LGDGTAESHSRIQTALNELYRFTAELFEMREEDSVLMNVGIVPDLSKLHPIWSRNIELTLTEANLELPAETFMQSGSRDGKHTEHLGFLLAEMQHLHRAFPGASW